MIILAILFLLVLSTASWACQRDPKSLEWLEKNGQIEEGKVEVKCWVLSSGEVSKVEILLTSGWPELDECARQALMKWEFSPIEGEEMQWA